MQGLQRSSLVPTERLPHFTVDPCEDPARGSCELLDSSGFRPHQSSALNGASPTHRYSNFQTYVGVALGGSQLKRPRLQGGMEEGDSGDESLEGTGETCVAGW